MAEIHVRTVSAMSQARGNRSAFAILKEIALDIGRDGSPCYTGIRKLADRANIAVSTAQLAIKYLEGLGEITVTRRKNASNLYSLNLSADSDAIDDERASTPPPQPQPQQNDDLIGILRESLEVQKRIQESVERMNAILTNFIDQVQKIVPTTVPTTVPIDDDTVPITVPIAGTAVPIGDEAVPITVPITVPTAVPIDDDTVPTPYRHRTDTVPTRSAHKYKDKDKEDREIDRTHAHATDSQPLHLQRMLAYEGQGQRTAEQKAMDEAIQQVVSDVRSLESVFNATDIAITLGVTPDKIIALYGSGGWWYTKSFGKSGKMPYARSIISTLRDAINQSAQSPQIGSRQPINGKRSKVPDRLESF